jgi:hypothetical protein
MKFIGKRDEGGKEKEKMLEEILKEKVWVKWC